MALAINPNETHDFVLKQDRDKPKVEQAVFKLRTLTASEHASLHDEGSMGGIAARRAQALVRAADLSLIGWLNLRGADGKDVPFPTKGDRRPVDYLDFNNVLEIGGAALDTNTVSEDDLGKSKRASG